MLIPPIENCLQKDHEGKCEKCIPNFVLFHGHCIRPFDYLLEGCADSNLDGKTELYELKCN